MFKQKPFLKSGFHRSLSGLGHVQAETVLVSGFHRSHIPVLDMFKQKPFLKSGFHRSLSGLEHTCL